MKTYFLIIVSFFLLNLSAGFAQGFFINVGGGYGLAVMKGKRSEGFA